MAKILKYKDKDGSWKSLPMIVNVGSYFDDADYNKESRLLEFYHNGEVVAEVDATPFIVDNFVDNVDIDGENIVITFNTEGKEPIKVPIDKIFKADNYYDKTESDGRFIKKSGADSTDLVPNLNSDLLDGKHAEDFLDKREDGMYPEITAGNAVNLQGNNEIVNSSAYRPTGGNEDVLFGTSQIENIQGNAVAWNQLVKNGNFANNKDWNVMGSPIDLAFNYNILTIKGIPDNTGAIQHFDTIKNHKYLYRIEYNTPNTTNALVRFSTQFITASVINKWDTLAKIIQNSESIENDYIALYTTSETEPTQFRNACVFDLTLIYGVVGSLPAP